MKKIFIPLFLVFSLFIPKPIFAGNDLIITCNNSECTELTGLSLFNETNIYPGLITTQKVLVKNNRNSTCNLTFKTISQSSSTLSQKILVNISDDKNSYLTNYFLSDLLNKTPISLGHIIKNNKNEYLWSLTFDQNANDNYQNLTTNFNIDFNFECDDISSSESGSSPNSNPAIATCNNSTPSAPTGLYATPYNSGSVTLHWTEPTSTHDGYLIAFGTSPGNYQYGAPRVSDDDHYTVQGLTPGAQYCFYVRSLNGCMPGGRTPEYCVNPGSNTPAAVPTVYQQQVLGDTTEITPTPSIETEDKNILGASDQETSNWWKLLFLLFIIPLYIGGHKLFVKK